MAFARVNGVVLHYRVLGPETAPALAFANSLGTDFRIWDEVVGRLDGRYRVLLYDKRGHGLSELPAGPYSIADHTNDLAALLDHVGIGRLALVGVSVGGMIAQDFAARFPDRIVAAVFSNTGHKIGTDAVWNERIASVEKGGIAAIADAVLLRWFTPSFHAQRSAELAGYRAMLTRQSSAGYAATSAGIRDADFTASTKALKLPVLCIAGDQDGSTPVDLVRSLSELVRGSDFRVIPDCGHIPCVERPDAVAGLIGSFLKSARHG